jgi:acyl dehydratase
MRGLTGMSYGRYFGELRPGEAFRHWPARTIHEYDDTLLSLLSMNQHPVHPGQHYAQNAQQGCRLVAGPTVISIVIGMTQADIGGGAIETLSYSHIRQTGLFMNSIIVEAETLPGGRGAVTIEMHATSRRRF